MLHLAGTRSQSTLSEFDSDQVQPNAIDLRVDKIFQSFSQVFVISEQEKQHRKSIELKPDENGWWRLDPGSYEIIMQGEISIGEDEAGWVITRSSLNRNGCFITSGLYDSGYHGVMAGVLHVNNGPMMVQQGTRVGQFLLFKSEALNQYDGDYGAGKQHDQKYGV
jgi:dUTP pyrophosphatase